MELQQNLNLITRILQQTEGIQRYSLLDDEDVKKPNQTPPPHPKKKNKNKKTTRHTGAAENY